MIGKMDGNQIRGRPCREWLGDFGDWCHENIQTLSRVALDWVERRQRVEFALDTYGLDAHGSLYPNHHHQR